MLGVSVNDGFDLGSDALNHVFRRVLRSPTE